MKEKYKKCSAVATVEHHCANFIIVFWNIHLKAIDWWTTKHTEVVNL